jgi:hypothetical protein
MPRSGIPRLVVSLLVGSLFIVACASPAVEIECPPHVGRDFGDINPFPDLASGTHYGIVALLFGWGSPWALPWLANVLLVIGWILLLLKKNAAALGFGIAMALFGFTTLAYLFVHLDSYHLTRLLVGYYLWQAGLIVFALGALFAWRLEPREK